MGDCHAPYGVVFMIQVAIKGLKSCIVKHRLTGAHAFKFME
jgi:hypothetical protein